MDSRSYRHDNKLVYYLLASILVGRRARIYVNPVSGQWYPGVAEYGELDYRDVVHFYSRVNASNTLWPSVQSVNLLVIMELGTI